MLWQSGRPRAQQEMTVGGHERPGIHDSRPVPVPRRHPVRETGPVVLAGKDPRPLDAPPHDMGQGAGGIQAGLSGPGAGEAVPAGMVMLS